MTRNGVRVGGTTREVGGLLLHDGVLTVTRLQARMINI